MVDTAVPYFVQPANRIKAQPQSTVNLFTRFIFCKIHGGKYTKFLDYRSKMHAGLTRQLFCCKGRHGSGADASKRRKNTVAAQEPTLPSVAKTPKRRKNAVAHTTDN